MIHLSLFVLRSLSFVPCSRSSLSLLLAFVLRQLVRYFVAERGRKQLGDLVVSLPAFFGRHSFRFVVGGRAGACISIFFSLRFIFHYLFFVLCLSCFVPCSRFYLRLFSGSWSAISWRSGKQPGDLVVSLPAFVGRHSFRFVVGGRAGVSCGGKGRGKVRVSGG